MPRHRNLLIVIADGAHVRLVRSNSDVTLRTEEAVDAVAAHKRSSDLVSDRPGASVHSDSSARHAFTPRHDRHRLEEERFADAVAELLNQAARAGGFEELLIAAPPRILNEIRKRLDREAETRIIGTLGKDLVKVPDHELWRHFAEWVSPVPQRPARA